MKFIPITVVEDMIGHRFGEFVSTRKLTVHKERKEKKYRYTLTYSINKILLLKTIY
jgi:ribosomal protein S19